MLLSELKTLDVVNVVDGSRLGKIHDIELDINNGNILSIKILTISKVKSFFKGEQIVVIPWERVVKIGDEVVIVNYSII